MHPLRPHPNRAFWSNLAWWGSFLVDWNSVSFLPLPVHLRALEMVSDASGSWGCEAWHRERCFQRAWDGRSTHLSIMVKEVIPIVLACAIWGPVWGTHRVICHCDNQEVVASAYTSAQAGIAAACTCCAHWPSSKAGTHFPCTPNTLTLEQTTSLTISYKTISLPSSIRYPRAIADPPLSQPSCWSCSWIQHWIRPHFTGSGCSEPASHPPRRGPTIRQ